MKKITSRKIHRYLSVVIGIQLLLWTVSGLIFSWNPIKKVRGEDRIRAQPPLDLANGELVEIGKLLADPNVVRDGSIVTRVEVREMLNKPVYELTLDGHEKKHVLIDAKTGKVLSPISQATAEEVALDDFSESASVVQADFIDTVQGPHSEYRKKEIPVWRVQLDHSSGTVIYVSANRGVVVTRRNDRWRLFDFVWMLHTMDYQGRDNFNSWLLRIMSALGVLSVLTGYWLWLRTWRRSKKNRAQSTA